MVTYNVQYVHQFGHITIPVEADNKRDAQIQANTFRDEILEDGFGPIIDMCIERDRDWETI